MNYKRLKSFLIANAKKIYIFSVLIVVYCLYEEILFKLYENGAVNPFIKLGGLDVGVKGINSAVPITAKQDSFAKGAHVCVIARFFGGQLEDPDYNMKGLLNSLTAQTNSNWEVLLLATDTSDISGVHEVVDTVPTQDQHKLRLLKYDFLTEEYTPTRAAKFHKKVYRMTDMALRQCSEDTKWLLVTNGDNTYDSTFLEYADHADVDSEVNLLAYDFYSRWLNKGKFADKQIFPPCGRLTKELGLDEIMPEATRYSCFPNRLKKGGTDLGANLLDYNKFISENRMFSSIESNDGSQDGFMIEALVKDNWKIHHVGTGEDKGKCLFDHNPNYHSCLAKSKDHFWDDTVLKCVNGGRKEGLHLQYSSTMLKGCVVEI